MQTRGREQEGRAAQQREDGSVCRKHQPARLRIRIEGICNTLVDFSGFETAAPPHPVDYQPVRAAAQRADVSGGRGFLLQRRKNASAADFVAPRFVRSASSLAISPVSRAILSVSSPTDISDMSCPPHAHLPVCAAPRRTRPFGDLRFARSATRLHKGTGRKQTPDELAADGGATMAGDTKIPARMTAVAISQPGGPLVLKPEKGDRSRARRRRDPDQGARGRRQPPRCAAAQGRLSAAARRLRPAGSRSGGRGRGARRRRRNAGASATGSARLLPAAAMPNTARCTKPMRCRCPPASP